MFCFCAGDFFIVWCRFTNYKTFPKKKPIKMEFTANKLGLDIKREEVEDNKYTLCKVVLTKRMNAQIDEDDLQTPSLLSLQTTTVFRMDPRKLRKSIDSESTFCKIIFTRRMDPHFEMMRTIRRQCVYFLQQPCFSEWTLVM